MRVWFIREISGRVTWQVSPANDAAGAAQYGLMHIGPNVSDLPENAGWLPGYMYRVEETADSAFFRVYAFALRGTPQDFLVGREFFDTLGVTGV